MCGCVLCVGVGGGGGGGGGQRVNAWKITHEASGEQESTSNSWVHKCQTSSVLSVMCFHKPSGSSVPNPMTSALQN